MGHFKIVVGDITDEKLLQSHDVIVNPTNPRMVCGAGVSQAIFHKAGVDALENYTQRRYNISYFTNDNLMKPGEIRITPGFELGLDIMFVQGPSVYDYKEYANAKRDLLDVYRKIIQTAYDRGYRYILCPSLGTGSYGFLHQDIAPNVVQVIQESIQTIDINLTLVLYQEEERLYYN